MSDIKQNDDLDPIPVLPENVPVVMPELPPRLYIATAQQFKAVSDPTRSRILGIIQNQPATAKQIADRLGATPGAIGHHLHVLETAGLAKVVARRQVRGIVANYYTRTARIFNYDFQHETTGGKSKGLRIMTIARDELAESFLTTKDDPLLTDGFPHIRLSPERAQVYSERLKAIIEDVLHETPDPEGEVYGIFLAIFKAPAYMQGPGISIHSESSVTDKGGIIHEIDSGVLLAFEVCPKEQHSNWFFVQSRINIGVLPLVYKACGSLYSEEKEMHPFLSQHMAQSHTEELRREATAAHAANLAHTGTDNHKFRRTFYRLIFDLPVPSSPISEAHLIQAIAPSWLQQQIRTTFRTIGLGAFGIGLLLGGFLGNRFGLLRQRY